MGFDLTGQNKETGETYFRQNVWGWRPIWSFVERFCDDLLSAEQLKRGNYNDFVEINGVESIMLATRLQALIDEGTVKDCTDVYETNRNKEVKAEEILMKALDQWTKDQGASCGSELEYANNELWNVMYRKINNNSDSRYPMSVENIQEFADYCKESDQGFKIG